MNELHPGVRKVDSTDDSRSVGKLLSQLGEDVGNLVSTEVNLAKAEMSESLQDAKTGIASLVVGAVVLFTGLLVLLNGLARTIGALTTLEPWLSFLLVGGLVTAIGAILLVNSKAKLSADNLKLTRTENALRRDKHIVEEKMS